MFLAEDVSLQRHVAVKVLQPALAGDESFLKRFGAEARSVASLNHPNVLRVFDWGEDEDGPYLVLEYLGGGSLRQMLDGQRRLTHAQATRLGAQAAEGLAYAHARGLVHRDIKPANLLFDDEGRVRIADFGVARALAEATWTEPVGAMIGTARYAAPEQAEGRPVDGRADVYALSLVLYEALTGEVPFVTDTTMGTLMARVGAPLPRHPGLGAMDDLLARAAAPDVEARLDAAQLAARLEALSVALPPAEPLPLRPPGVAPRPAQGFRAPGVEELTGQVPAVRPPDGPPPHSDRAVPAAAGLAAGGAVAMMRAGPGEVFDAEALEPARGVPPDSPGGAPSGLATPGPPGPAGPGLAASAVPVGEQVGRPATGPTVAHRPPTGAGPTVADPPAPGAGRSSGDGGDGATAVTAATATTTGAAPWAIPAGAPVPTGGGAPTAPAHAARVSVAAPPPPAARSTRRRRRWPWVVAVAALVLLVVGGLLTAARLKVFTPSHRVPSLVHLTLPQARNALVPLHLALSEGPPVFSISMPAGDIVSQRPAVAASVKEGSSVLVVTSKGLPPVTVPSLLGLNCVGAQRLLAASHLVGLCPPAAAAYENKVPAGQVINWSWDNQVNVTSAPYGATILMAISKGPQPVTLQDYSGDTYQQAAADLQAAGLVATESTQQSADTPAGQVISTDPGAGQSVAVGSTVTVVVSSGVPDPVVPDVAGESTTQANLDLVASGFTLRNISGPRHGTVVSQDPPAGSQAPPGTAVALTTQ